MNLPRRALLSSLLLSSLVACGSSAASSADAGSKNPPGADGSTSGDGDSNNHHGDGDGDTPNHPGDGDTGGDGDGSSHYDGGTITPVPGLGAAEFADGELDAPSHGGSITFQNIGKAGSYPSRSDPASGDCSAYDKNGCCLATHQETSDQLTPWNEELIMTLRGPMQIKQLAVYQPDGDAWSLVSGWDQRSASNLQGVAFKGNNAENGFDGHIGTECLVDVATASDFACGAGSSPFCPDDSPGIRKHGWAGSKLIILLARMAHNDSTPEGTRCSQDNSGNWYDAPWIGLSLAELVRAGAFQGCQCYAQSPDNWSLGDGCGQFNVFEVVNDNNQYKNLDVFSTNFFGYAGYVGEGPCGSACNVSTAGANADLIDKSNSMESAMGAISNPDKGPGNAFIRPSKGYRYFMMLLDESARSIQLAVVHPSQIPQNIAPLLPALPKSVASDVVKDVLDMRLPR